MARETVAEFFARGGKVSKCPRGRTEKPPPRRGDGEPRSVTTNPCFERGNKAWKLRSWKKIQLDQETV